MDCQLIEQLIDEKIRRHEIRVGIVSGIVGLLFLGAVLLSVLHLYSLIQQ
jgi:hypothetical protein